MALTPPGGELRPPPGIYGGPVVIDRPITIDGGGEVTVDGGGHGTVVTVKADGTVLRGLRLVNSGDSHDAVDAGILLEADDALIEGNHIEDTLFGIHLRGAADGVVRGNRIRSKALPVRLRGDGIRLWYSHGNRIEGNRLDHVRDLILTNAADNEIVGNEIVDSGVGLQLVFSPDNRIEDNRIEGDGTGIVVLYSDGVSVRGNRLGHLRRAAGAALAVKESSEVSIEGNEVLHCAVGMEVNAPTDPENILRVRGNRFAYNDVAMYFYGEKGGHVIEGNRFEQNLTEVAVSAYLSARDHRWSGNYWDGYRGFDTDGDGIGDTPHEIHLYSDRLWLDRPMTRFFRGSPALELIDFMERLAPFSEPRLVLRDPAPRIR